MSHRSLYHKLVTGWATFGAWVGGMAAAHAQADIPVDPRGIERSIPRQFQSLPDVINTIFNVVIGAAGVIFLILLLVGGVMYLTAAGNEENTGKARRLMIDSVVGLLIVLAAYAIGRYVLGVFGLDSAPEQGTQF